MESKPGLALTINRPTGAQKSRPNRATIARLVFAYFANYRQEGEQLRRKILNTRRQERCHEKSGMGKHPSDIMSRRNRTGHWLNGLTGFCLCYFPDFNNYPTPTSDLRTRQRSISTTTVTTGVRGYTYLTYLSLWLTFHRTSHLVRMTPYIER